MQFSFYPNHPFGCEHVGHCPHLGNAALGTLVLLANTGSETTGRLYRIIDNERASIAKLVEENQQLRQELEQAKLD